MAGPHGAYVTKSEVGEYTPYDLTVWFDADTVINSPIDYLWPHDGEIVLTKFSGWDTHHRILRRRLGKWRHVVPELVTRAEEKPYEGINTGVFAFDKVNPIMQAWHSLVHKNQIHICDEVAMQLIFPDFKHRLISDEWNCCPRQGLSRDEKPKIYHYHGFTHLSNHGKRSWLPAYGNCREKNVCDLQSWENLGELTAK
jgi:hypothetical protein